MNYEKIYNQLVERRKVDILCDGYKENHHIIPRSLGGSDEADNIVALTAREHFIAHLLLTKILKTGPKHYKMVRALNMMLCTSVGRPRYTPSRIYESLRISFSKAQSVLQSGENNSQFGKMWITNPESGKSKKIKKDAIIPDGWVKGRKIRRCQ